MEAFYQFVKDVGPAFAILILATLYLLRFLDRRSKVEARDSHSHLDDTETLREFAKADRITLSNFIQRNVLLTEKNAELERRLALHEGASALFEEKTRNDLNDCSDKQAALQAEIDELKLALEELRGIVIIKNTQLEEKDRLIAQLRAS